MKKKPPFNQNATIRGAIRRAFARSPSVIDKMNESRREVPRYRQDGSRAKKNWVQRQCEVCQQWASSTKMSVDHIEPVVSVDDGFIDWNVFVARLWCDKSNLQRICDDCHDKKTYKERITRNLKQYTKELDELEKNLNDYLASHSIDNADSLYKKLLSKYTAKKKTKEFAPIVQRAQALKDLLKK